MAETRESQRRRCITLILSQPTVSSEEKERSVRVWVIEGKTLAEVVEPILEYHDISLEDHSLFLESSPLPVNTPLPLNGESIHYGGDILHVRSNKEAKKMSRKRNTFKRLSLRIKRGRVSSVDINSDFVALLQKEGESEKEVQENKADNDFELENSLWDIISEDNMPYKRKLQQEAIWELFTTEVGYIKDLELIIFIFQARFKILQYSGYLTEVDDKLIFANIHEVYHANVTFWERLKLVISNTRETRQPICPSDLAKSFKGFGELFQSYIGFCNADVVKVKLPDYKPSTNEMIRLYFAWCGNQKQCRRLTLSAFLVKPLQRMTKYSLLLKAIANKTEDKKEKLIAEQMMTSVETFVSKINASMALRQEREKLYDVIKRLSLYCPIEPVNEEVESVIKEFSDSNVTGSIPGLPDCENRFILKEGPMQLVEKEGKKEVYVFLFSDALVVTTLRNIDSYCVSRPPYRLDKIFVRDLSNSGQILIGHLNEFGVLADAFVVQVDVSEYKKWRLTLKKAKEDYQLKRRGILEKATENYKVRRTSEYGSREELREHDVLIDKNNNLTEDSANVEKHPLSKNAADLNHSTIANIVKGYSTKVQHKQLEGTFSNSDRAINDF